MSLNPDQLPGQWASIAEAAGLALAKAQQPIGELIHPGFSPLFKAVGYLEPGDLVVVGAGTNVGKTFFILTLLLSAWNEGTPGGFVSCEDPVERIGSRVIRSAADVSQVAMKMRQLTESDVAVLEDKIADLEKYNIPVYRPKESGHKEVLAALRVMAQRGARIVAVDYMQHVDLDETDMNSERRREVQLILSALKAEAKRLGIALIVASQFSRSPTSGGKPREPSTSDLAESSAIEQKSEIVLLMWLDLDAPAHFPIVHRDICAWVAKSKDGWIGPERWEMHRASSGLLVPGRGGMYDPAAEENA